ncbi:MAG: rhodanese-like domain-containing protein, partial [Phycisphaerae bacterium]
VFYCSCPNEGSSARVALLLHRKGFTRVRPLQGGINAWRQANYPTETWITATTTANGGILADRDPAPAHAIPAPVAKPRRNYRAWGGPKSRQFNGGTLSRFWRL